MNRDRLVLDDDGSYRIVWELHEEQEIGATLGDSGPGKPLDPKGEHEAAEAAVWDMADGRDNAGLYWESKGAAQKALVIARRAIAEFSGAKPWPEWAKMAQANGWKPPKGWTP